ncbi:hypothetical protein A0H81_08934 [Grifola frondosa]|uniref:Uncharacterized protein n=1 Tax=Grifola frondosa TaxID=5627 RepID=A0A1C7M4Y7_GRIFR|nr:hypothetical protein A0H81_08934 [Grifola frondosa]
MTNWQDPSVIADNYAALGTMSWVFGSIFLWEWITTLGFEWRIITRQMDLKWPMLVCVVSRLSMLGVAIGTFIAQSLTTQFNCDASFRAMLALGYLSVCLVSFLIALRTIAIWNRHNDDIRCTLHSNACAFLIAGDL